MLILIRPFIKTTS